MRYFPVFFDLRDARVVVVGGGEEALRKVRLLLKTEARIEVIAPAIHAELAANPRVKWLARKYAAKLLDGAKLVYSADPALNAKVSADAQARNIPVNAVDQAEISTFIVPSIVDRDPVVIAIGTEGAAPVLAQGIRARVDAMLPANLGQLAGKAQGFREKVARLLPPGNRRRAFWQDFFFGNLRDAMLAGDAVAESLALEDAAYAVSKSSTGRVSLVGAGPGDPEQLTLKAQCKLQEADVIIYDRFVSDSILEMSRRDAVRIAMDKTGRQTMIAEALKGLRVVWLTGGEAVRSETTALAHAGIAFDVVQGIAFAAALKPDRKLADVVPFPIREDIQLAALRAVS